MARCRACTAELPEGAAVCPACDEPVARKSKTKKAKKPAPPSESDAPADAPAEASEPGDARDAETVEPATMPGNDARVALTAGVGSVALAFVPLLFSLFWASQLAGVAVICGGVAVWKATGELSAIDAGVAPDVGKRPATIGRFAGLGGIALAILGLVGKALWVFLLAGLLTKRHR